MSRFNQVGIDRLIRLDWLIKTSSLILSGNDEKNLKDILCNELQGYFRSNNTKIRGSLDKTITILLKVWEKPPKELVCLNKTGLELLTIVNSKYHIALHWGMLMSVYPFWGNVAYQFGKLLKLQDTINASNIQRRLREIYGERETVSRRVRYVLRSFIDWGVIIESGEKGVYKQGNSYNIQNPHLVAWMAEALLMSKASGSSTMQEIMNNPIYFPFQMMFMPSEKIVSLAPRIEIIHLGLNDTLLTIKK